MYSFRHLWRAAAAALALALTVSSLALPAAAADVTVGSIRISDAWARATPAGAKVGAGYLTITNTGPQPDRLLGGTTLVAGIFELHEMAMVDNVMRMRALPKGIEIKPGETIALRPGGLHVMFMDLKQQLKEGEPVKGTLVFEKAGTVQIEYRVAPVAAKAPAPDTGTHKH